MNDYTDMKGLSFWQPYGTLEITDIKIYETRSWATKFRGFIAIHAAARPIAKTLDEISEEDVLEQILYALQELDIKLWALKFEELLKKFKSEDILPLGAIIGTAKLVTCHKITEEFKSRLTPRELALGDFTVGRYAWEFSHKKQCAPIPMKVAQGLFYVRIKHSEVVRI
jgi:hypothetical protein